jgi:2,4-dienoyl-CoA reductase-like NADH-dependent reductase (Old Yellow Enzyme family)
VPAAGQPDAAGALRGPAEYGGNFGKPRAATEADIQDIIQRFPNTAALVKEAGFDGVQIHSAHGYLLSQFLSPRTNQRQDRWGGSLANRASLLLEVIRAVRARVGLGLSDFRQAEFVGLRQGRLHPGRKHPGRAVAERCGH